MSCKVCLIHKGEFSTESQYRALKERIASLIENGDMEYLGEVKPSVFYEDRYQCKKCGQVWILSTPDQAFRGGWEEESSG